MQGREVDEALMEERERDIKQINEDLVLVKEMFKGKIFLTSSIHTTIDSINHLRAHPTLMM